MTDHSAARYKQLVRLLEDDNFNPNNFKYHYDINIYSYIKDRFMTKTSIYDLLNIKRINYLFYLLNKKNYKKIFYDNFIYFVNDYFNSIIILKSHPIDKIKYYYNKIIDNLINIGHKIDMHSYTTGLLCILLYNDDSILSRLYKKIYATDGDGILIENDYLFDSKIILYLVKNKYKYSVYPFSASIIRTVFQKTLTELANIFDATIHEQSAQISLLEHENAELREKLANIEFLPPDAGGTEYLAAAANFGTK